MSENAQTLIKAALRVNGVTNQSPGELQDGLEALQLMLRSWSANNLRIYYTETHTLSMSGADSYTIGSGGDISTVRPVEIRGAWFTEDRELNMVSEGEYRRMKASVNSGGDAEFLYYDSEYSLGVLYPWPTGGSTMYIHALQPLTDPTALTSSISFPPEYDEAIKWGLAARLALEFGREPSPAVVGLAAAALNTLETKNFAGQINAVKTEILALSHNRYNIDQR